jgi:hypothetical protein
MKKVRFSRYYPLLCLPVLLALVGIVWGRPGKQAMFDQDDLKGRYVSAETWYNTKPVVSADDAVGPPFFNAATAVMVADGKGYVCGEQDGFNSGISSGTNGTGTNTGPDYFFGSYTIDANGRITINTCHDTALCHTKAVCETTGFTLRITQVGYLQSPAGNKVTTVEQHNDSEEECCSYTTGSYVHARVWTKEASEGMHY